MKYFLLITSCLLLIISCSCNKKYKYVEIVNEKSIIDGTTEMKEDEAVEISAPNDTDAYLIAFRKFCISSKMYEEMVKKGNGDFVAQPLRFELYNDKGIEIASSISFASKEKEEAEIMKSVMDLDMGNDDSNQEEVKSKIDSAKIKELLPYFKVKKDEFDPNGKIVYTPKSAPQYINRNGIYCYFIVTDGTPGPLRFVVQYYADDWLFFKRVQFSIDGNAFEFVPLKTETDNGDGGKIWEWFDEALTSSDHDLIYALSNAHSAKMKFLGQQYYDIKNISQLQITDIKRALDLYHAMGGTY